MDTNRVTKGDGAGWERLENRGLLNKDGRPVDGVVEVSAPEEYATE